MGKFLLFAAAKCNTKDGTAVRNVTPEVNASVDMNASVCGCECACECECGCVNVSMNVFNTLTQPSPGIIAIHY